MLQNAKVTAFTELFYWRFWLIKGKPTGEGKYPLPRLGLMRQHGERQR